MSDKPREHSATESIETPASTDRSPETESAPNTLLNAVIGGIVGVVLSFIPFSTVLGGGVAGYLEGGDSASGMRVGALAGLISFVPIVFIFGAILVFVPVFSVPGGGVQFALWVSLLLLVLFAVLYTIGLGIIGGVVGVYVKEEL